MINRSRLEILADILQAANDGIGVGSSSDDGIGASQTAIMYKAFLSYGQLKGYISLLTESNLLQYNKAMQKFKITEKGHRFLKLYIEINEVTKMRKFAA